ncbi:MAG TPA: glycosyltransferase family A protein [Candidatus Binatia bacterium]
MKQLNVTLLICSRNRAASLQRCLDSINPEEMLEAETELVLVDNGSTDDTQQVMRSFQRKVPFPVEVVDEPRPGLSYARNAGLVRVRGDVIVFSDDDCYLAPGYLLTASRVFDSGQFHYCGGRIFLYDPTDARYGVNRKEKFERLPPGSFIPAGKIQGANMVFHRSVIDKIGPFDTMLGAGTPFRVEDIDYCARASMAGFTGAHVPELVVYHHHGRKPGTNEFERWTADNDYGRGAYYMKFILLRKYVYLRKWLKSAFRLKKLPATIRELRGAIHYARERARASQALRRQI